MSPNDTGTGSTGTGNLISLSRRARRKEERRIKRELASQRKEAARRGRRSNLDRRLREQELEEQRKIEKEKAAAEEAARKERLAKEKAEKIERETAMAKERFEKVVADGKIRQLDWKGATRMLDQLELETAEGQLALKHQKRKVECMEKMQDILTDPEAVLDDRRPLPVPKI